MRSIPENVLSPSEELLDAATITAHAMPVAPEICGVYFLISNGEIVYVGQSVNIMARIYNHVATTTDDRFDSFAVMPVPAESLDRVESAYVAALAPRYNFMGVPKEVRRPKNREYGLSWGKVLG